MGKVQENNGEVCVYDVCEVLNYFKKFKTSEKFGLVNPLTMLKVRWQRMNGFTRHVGLNHHNRHTDKF